MRVINKVLYFLFGMMVVMDRSDAAYRSIRSLKEQKGALAAQGFSDEDYESMRRCERESFVENYRIDESSLTWRSADIFAEITTLLMHRAEGKQSSNKLENAIFVEYVQYAINKIKEMNTTKKEVHSCLFLLLCSAIQQADGFAFEHFLTYISDVQVFFWYNVHSRTLLHEMIKAVIDKNHSFSEKQLFVLLSAAYHAIPLYFDLGEEVINYMLHQKTLRKPLQRSVLGYIQKASVIARDHDDHDHHKKLQELSDIFYNAHTVLLALYTRHNRSLVVPTIKIEEPTDGTSNQQAARTKLPRKRYARRSFLSSLIHQEV